MIRNRTGIEGLTEQEFLELRPPHKVYVRPLPMDAHWIEAQVIARVEDGTVRLQIIDKEYVERNPRTDLHLTMELGDRVNMSYIASNQNVARVAVY